MLTGNVSPGLVQESVEIDATVRELAEGALLLELDGLVHGASDLLQMLQSINV